MSELSYRLDAGDRLQAVSGNWEASARQGGATTLAGDAVLGRSLWEFVRDATLRDIYGRLFVIVRSRGEPLSFDYRCDTPTERRLMRMTLTPLGNANIEIANAQVWADPRPPVRQQNVFRGSATVRCCSLCNHFEIEGQWVDVCDAVSAGMLGRVERSIRVAFAVCAPCRARVESMLGRLEAG
ncbi:MAG: hypothetical protein AB7P21_01045 [Lautropia sp.]